MVEVHATQVGDGADTSGIAERYLKHLSLAMRFPELAKFVVRCSACGREGRDARVVWETFEPRGYGEWIRAAFVSEYDVMPLNDLGLCDACRRHAPEIDSVSLGDAGGFAPP